MEKHTTYLEGIFHKVKISVSPKLSQELYNFEGSQYFFLLNSLNLAGSFYEKYGKQKHEVLSYQVTGNIVKSRFIVLDM
jgi:hypothetical protein